VNFRFGTNSVAGMKPRRRFFVSVLQFTWLALAVLALFRVVLPMLGGTR
jgi:hypothetical protein